MIKSINKNIFTPSILWKLGLINIIIISLICYVYSVNICDPFLPNHLARIDNIVSFGEYTLGDSLENNAAGCYNIYAAIICLVLGIDAMALFWTPLTIAPIVIITYALYRILSHSHIISSILSSVGIIILASFSSYLLFWIHAYGFIFYIFYLLLIFLYIHNKINSPKLLLLAAIDTFAIIYISYDFAGILLCTIGFLFLISVVRHYIYSSTEVSEQRLNPVTMFILMIIFAAFISYNAFVSSMFIPYLQEYGDISTIFSLLFPHVTPLNEIYYAFNFPIITILNLSRYILYLIIFIVFILFIYINSQKKLLKYENNIIIFSVLMGLGLYCIIRLVIGSASDIVYLFFPASLCLAYLFLSLFPKASNTSTAKMSYLRWKKIAIILLVSLSIVVAVYFGFYAIYVGDEQRYLTSYSQYESNADWVTENIDSNIVVKSDTLTKNMLLLFKIQNNAEAYYTNLNQKFITLSLEDVSSIITIDNKLSNNKYIVVNYMLASPSIGENWDRMKSWYSFKEKINNNINYNVIYTSSGLAVFTLL